MNNTLRKLYDAVLEEQDYSVELRRELHEFPELPKKEYNTCLIIERELDKLNIKHRRVGETGVYAEIKGNKAGDRCIILRADIDALPMEEKHECSYKSQNVGVMHACGHDAHTASLLTATKILENNKDSFAGTIRLVFQQAEEIGHGARVFINEGLLDGADRCFGIHVASNLEVGKIALVSGPNNASVDWFKIHIKGHSAHVSTPQLGVDALYVASQIVVSIQALVSRLNSPMDNVLIGIGKMEAGTAYNIVASDATLEGTVRVLTQELRNKTKKQIELLVNNIALIYGATAFVEWKDFTSPLVNDESSTKEAIIVATDLFEEENVIKYRTPSLGGDDFAELILHTPGVYAYVGSKNVERLETCVAHHDVMFDIDESCLSIATAMHVGYAIWFLNGEKYE